jgi:hypothetical protein
MELWKDTMIATVRRTWETEYKDCITSEEDEEVKRRARKPDFLEKYLNRALSSTEGDDFNAYITAPPLGCSDDDASLLTWWDRPNNPHRALQQQAFDFAIDPCDVS